MLRTKSTFESVAVRPPISKMLWPLTGLLVSTRQWTAFKQQENDFKELSFDPK
jgi:hypothetical protein